MMIFEQVGISKRACIALYGEDKWVEVKSMAESCLQWEKENGWVSSYNKPEELDLDEYGFPNSFKKYIRNDIEYAFWKYVTYWLAIHYGNTGASRGNLRMLFNVINKIFKERQP